MVTEELSKILGQGKQRIREAYASEEMEFIIIEIIRALDYAMFMLKQDLEMPQKQWLIEKYRFGWGLAFSIFYSDYKIQDKIPAFAFDNETRKWVDNVIQNAGCMETCAQFLSYCKAGLMNLTKQSHNKFTFTYTLDNPAEYYEKLSVDYYFGLATQIYQERIAKLTRELPYYRGKLKELVNIFQDDYLSYKATEEIEKFYIEFGHLYLMTTQIIDDFAETDTFGDIQYKEYLDFAEDLIMSAIMHRDCCMALAEKTNHKIYLRNILTYTFAKDLFLQNYSNVREISIEKTAQIASNFIIDKSNFKGSLGYPGACCPPFVELAENLLMRSSHGCLDMPIFYLNRELKRKYPKDYFTAVNNREARFKEQLYSIFPDRLTKIKKNIIIKIGNQSTDIDGIVFDKDRRTLGLFQLKWQDAFSTSMQERFSRISNLIPKSVEWIDKLQKWISTTDSSSLLNKLNLADYGNTIEDIYLFVISRNHVHFSSQILDNRAVWASWYQVIESSAKVKDPFQSNPIGELAAKLKFFSPDNRKEFENSQIINDFDFQLSSYEISIKCKPANNS